MKMILWGAGEMSRRVLPYIGKENVVAIIDSNIEKIGTLYMEIPVISLEEYNEMYSNLPILITPFAEKEIENELKKHNISFYYRLSDCPGEFSNIEYSPVLENFSMAQIVENRKYIIYGNSLFTIVLNQWIKKNKGYYLPIVLPESTDKIICANIKCENPEMSFILENEHIMGMDNYFLVTDEWYIRHLRENGIEEKKIVNLYDISDREKSYYNAQIEQYKDIHKGESCFIIGHGPSLRADDLDVLEANNAITFSMNLTYHLFDKTSWRPDYYVAADRGMIKRYSYFKWNEHTKRKCFIADISEEFWKNNQSEDNIKYHSIRNVNIRESKFSDDVSKRVYCGANVVYDCMQIAAYMGFKKIYLIGMDLVPYKQEDEVSGSYINYFEQDNVNVKPQMWIGKILRAYQAAKEYANTHNIQIYNATRGGYLEIFERVDFDKLFGV